MLLAVFLTLLAASHHAHSHFLSAPPSILVVTLPGAPSHARLLTHLGARLHLRGANVAVLTERVDGYKQANGLKYYFYDPLLSESDWRAGARAVRFTASTDSMMGGFRNWAAQTDTLLRNVTLMRDIKLFKPTVILGDFHFLASFALSEFLSVPLVYFSCPPLGEPFHSEMLNIPNDLTIVPQFGSRIPPPGKSVLLVQNIVYWMKNKLFSHIVKGRILAPVLAAHNLSVAQLYSSKQPPLTLVNTHPAFDWARPLPPYVHYVGPMLWSHDGANSSEQAMPDSDFILISFGTLASLSERELLAIVEGLTHLRVQFIWKLTEQDLPSSMELSRLRDMIPANVVLKNWIDQVALLNHEGCRGFLTHGGINGLLEAASAGIPVAILPLLGDQEDNTEKAVFQGYGIRVSTVSPESIRRSLLRLLHDDVLSIRARQLSVKIAATSTLRAPVDRAADLVEAFIESGAAGPSS